MGEKLAVSKMHSVLCYMCVSCEVDGGLPLDMGLKFLNWYNIIRICINNMKIYLNYGLRI